MVEISASESFIKHVEGDRLWRLQWRLPQVGVRTFIKVYSTSPDFLSDWYTDHFQDCRLQCVQQRLQDHRLDDEDPPSFRWLGTRGGWSSCSHFWIYYPLFLSSVADIQNKKSIYNNRRALPCDDQASLSPMFSCWQLYDGNWIGGNFVFIKEVCLSLWHWS